MSSSETGDVKIPEIFQGEIPEAFYKFASEKYKLPQRSRIANFLNRLFFNRHLDAPEATDLAIRALYKQYLAETTEEEVRRSLSEKEAALSELETRLAEARADSYDSRTDLPRPELAKRQADEILSHVGGDRLIDPIDAVCFVTDIVGFKEINRVFGYERGHEFIRAKSDFLKQIVRDTDVLSRWGGDEFVLLAPVFQGSSVEEVKGLIEDRLAEVPQSETFPKQIRWDSTVYQEGDNLDAMVARVDITTDQGKKAAKESRINPCYSNR